MKNPISTEPYSSFKKDWSGFLERFDSANDRLIGELENCWRELQTALENQIRQIEAIPLKTFDQPVLDNFQKARGELSQRFLHEPLAQWERRQPFKRASMAIERYDRNVEDLIRTLPETVSVNGPMALHVLEKGGPGLLARLVRIRRKELLLPLKSLAYHELQSLSSRRLKIEGPYFLLFDLAFRQLKKNWELASVIVDNLLRKGRRPDLLLTESSGEAKRSTERLLQQAEKAHLGWRSWPGTTLERFGRRILFWVVWPRQVKAFDPGVARTLALRHWAERLRAVEAEVKLEQALERCEGRVLDLFRRAVESEELELASLQAELDDFIAWLRRQIAGREERLPLPKTDMTPAAVRLLDLTHRLKVESESLPDSCVSLSRLSVVPRRHSNPHLLYPRETLYQSFLRTGRQEIGPIFEEIEASHRKIVHEIERAREVVCFGLGSDGTDQNLDPQVTQEAMQNALSLLEFQQGDSPQWLAPTSARLAESLSAVFMEARLILRRHGLGVFTYLTRQGLRRALPMAGNEALAASTRFLRNGIKFLEQVVLAILVHIGWRQQPSAGKAEFVSRVYLPQEFVTDLRAKELPAIYRRLFRFEAVEDPRFLVGRDRELAAIAEARSFWEAGRPVSIILVGERGSGKTSLINCAVSQTLQDVEIVRGEFKNRLRTESELYGFLASLFGTGNPDQLRGLLMARRRVVILEELERTFLRQVGGYGALRAMQRLISATCASTLWILVVNQVSFKFLDAVVNLGDSFSHRIDAASAGNEALRLAVSLRHNLSGLRLHFSLPPSQHPWREWLRAKLKGRADPETVFFDTLAKESAGVFRTAFDIWLGQIERVESGLLYMKPLVLPDLSSLIGALHTADLFTLVAILQHGSLTPEEHAHIFQKTIAASQTQMDELMAREIVEADPGRAGIRVRPEALPVVHEALYRRNLL